jgi:hypothetical protein
MSVFYSGVFDLRSASLETPISHGILIFPRENELNALGKMRIPWEIGVSKLARKESIVPGLFSDFFLFLNI